MFGIQTATSLVTGETRTSSFVDAVLTVAGQFESRGALTLEGTVLVDAAATETFDFLFQHTRSWSTLRGAFVHVSALSLIGRVHVALEASTLEGPVGIAARSQATHVGFFDAFVDVQATLSVGTEPVSRLTLALEAAHRVSTAPVLTHAKLHPTLVHVNAFGGALKLESGVAKTLEGPGAVDAIPVVGTRQIPTAFVNVYTLVPKWRKVEPGIAGTPEGAFQVRTTTVLANIWLLKAFVQVLTVPATGRQLITIRATAFKPARYIDAQGTSGTRTVTSLLAFVYVFAVE